MTLSLAISISAPPEAIYAVGTDYRRFSEWCPGIASIEPLSEGALRVGTRFTEHRLIGHRLAKETLEFLELEPPRVWVLGATSGGVHYRSRFALCPDGLATRLEFTVETKPLTRFAKLSVRLFGGLVKGAMTRILKADLAALKAHVEGQHPRH